MELFHGSHVEVSQPTVAASRRLLDFGTGFYTTTDKGQAVQFTRRFRATGREQVVSAYLFDEPRALAELSVRRFDAANLDWLEYVVANRSGNGADGDFDLVIGPVANDRVYDVVETYELGDYTVAEAISRLKSFKLTDQVVFKTEAALRHLTFSGSIVVGEGGGRVG
jgi:hypothetical protein